MSGDSNNIIILAHDLDAAQATFEHLLNEQTGSEQTVKLQLADEHSYPYSVIRILDVRHPRSGHTRYYLKRVIAGPMQEERTRERLKTEADFLALLNNKMPNEIVQLAACLPEYMAVITQECRGTLFNKQINVNPLTRFTRQYRKSVTKTSAVCGDWLHRFHGITSAPSQDLGDWLEFLAGEAEWREPQLTKLDPANRNLYQQTVKKLDSDLKEISSIGVKCMLHGDFAPHNIFSSGDSIQVLDFSSVREGHPSLDMINYIGKIATLRENPFIAAGIVRDMCMQFCSRYGPVELPDKGLLTLLIVLQCIKRLLVLHQCASKLRRYIHRDSIKWYLTYLYAYQDENRQGDLLKKGPWPFLELNRFFVTS